MIIDDGLLNRLPNWEVDGFIFRLVSGGPPSRRLFPGLSLLLSKSLETRLLGRRVIFRARTMFPETACTPLDLRLPRLDHPQRVCEFLL